MAGSLSAHAQLLLAYATQAAKQHGHGVVLPVHVALAALGRNRARADEELGDLVGEIDAYARQLPAGISTPVVSDSTVELLAAINIAGDEWPVLKARLPEYLKDPVPAGTPRAEDALATVAGAAGTPLDDLPSPAPPPAPLMGLSDVLAHFVDDLKLVVAALPEPVASGSALPWTTSDLAERALLDDLWNVFQWLATADGAWDEAEIRLLHDFFGARAGPGTLPAHEAGPAPAADPAASDAADGADVVPPSVGPTAPLFCALHAADQTHGTRHAERYARGLVRVAQSICSVDHEVGMDEAHQLDQLRIRFRDVLVGTAGSDGSTDGPTMLVGNQATADALAELDDLIGLTGVKAELRAFIQLAWINRLRQERGHAVTVPTLHMAFLGNPGTGKTTVARLLGRIFGSLGILAKGHFIEVDRLGLIAEYVGHTAPKVHALVERSRGGVLFIDEAYSLTPAPQGGGYEREAIDTLMKLMEDLRQEIVVVVAGYPELMARFFASNPGLAGRIATHLYFPDYSLDELMAIFDSFCQQGTRICQPEARSQVRKVLDGARKFDGFGNGRDVRNLYELLERHQAARLAPLGEFATDDDLATFVIADIPAPPEVSGGGTYL